jgi:hypothetical protein
MSTPRIGEIRRFDSQSDFFERRYEVIEKVEGSTFKVRLLEVEPDKLVRMIEDKYTDADEEIARTGEVMEIKFVSAAEYHRHF